MGRYQAGDGSGNACGIPVIACYAGSKVLRLGLQRRPLRCDDRYAVYHRLDHDSRYA